MIDIYFHKFSIIPNIARRQREKKKQTNKPNSIVWHFNENLTLSTLQIIIKDYERKKLIYINISEAYIKNAYY